MLFWMLMCFGDWHSILWDRTCNTLSTCTCRSLTDCTNTSQWRFVIVVECEPWRISCRIAWRVGLCQLRVFKVLLDQHLHPYHFQTAILYGCSIVNGCIITLQASSHYARVYWNVWNVFYASGCVLHIQQLVWPQCLCCYHWRHCHGSVSGTWWVNCSKVL
jgi:hypothetical protein